MTPWQKDFPEPDELIGEDVFDIVCLFDNEQEVIDHAVNQRGMNKDAVIEQLHEEDGMRKEFGKKDYLRSLQLRIDLYVSELMSGQYVMWESY